MFVTINKMTDRVPGWVITRCVMALIRGVGSLFPCPRCLIPEAKLGELSASAPLRTTASMKAIIMEARGMRSGEKEALLKSFGLRDVDVRLSSYRLCFVL